MIVSSSLEPALPALLKYLLDDGFANNQDSWDWLLYPGLVFGIFLLRAIVGLIADYAMTWVAQNVIGDLRKRMFDCLLRLPTTYFGENLSGRLMSRVTSDVNGVSSAATTALTTVVKDSQRSA
jgi:subfamily B ATP-binding cassette protein MsbA